MYNQLKPKFINLKFHPTDFTKTKNQPNKFSENQLLNLNIKAVFVIPPTTNQILQPLFSKDIHVTVVTKALIINVIHTVSALCAIFFYIKRFQIFTQLKKVIGKRVWTITNMTDLMNFQRWRYWCGFWYFLWLLNKFWFAEEQTINANDLICKFCEFSRIVKNYISW